jgi:hypothetical protein
MRVKRLERRTYWMVLILCVAGAFVSGWNLLSAAAASSDSAFRSSNLNALVALVITLLGTVAGVWGLLRKPEPSVEEVAWEIRGSARRVIGEWLDELDSGVHDMALPMANSEGKRWTVRQGGLDELLLELDRSSQRLHVIEGTAGSGKTRLLAALGSTIVDSGLEEYFGTPLLLSLQECEQWLRARSPKGSREVGDIRDWLRDQLAMRFLVDAGSGELPAIPFYLLLDGLDQVEAPWRAEVQALIGRFVAEGGRAVCTTQDAVAVANGWGRLPVEVLSLGQPSRDELSDYLGQWIDVTQVAPSWSELLRDVRAGQSDRFPILYEFVSVPLHARIAVAIASDSSPEALESGEEIVWSTYVRAMASTSRTNGGQDARALPWLKQLAVARGGAREVFRLEDVWSTSPRQWRVLIRAAAGVVVGIVAAWGFSLGPTLYEKLSTLVGASDVAPIPALVSAGWGVLIGAVTAVSMTERPVTRRGASSIFRQVLGGGGPEGLRLAAPLAAVVIGAVAGLFAWRGTGSASNGWFVALAFAVFGAAWWLLILGGFWLWRFQDRSGRSYVETQGVPLGRRRYELLRQVPVGLGRGILASLGVGAAIAATFTASGLLTLPNNQLQYGFAFGLSIGLAVGIGLAASVAVVLGIGVPVMYMTCVARLALLRRLPLRLGRFLNEQSYVQPGTTAYPLLRNVQGEFSFRHREILQALGGSPSGVDGGSR